MLQSMTFDPRAVPYEQQCKHAKSEDEKARYINQSEGSIWHLDRK